MIARQAAGFFIFYHTERNRPMKQLTALLTIVLAFSSTPFCLEREKTDETIVVSADLIAEELRETGSSTTIITAEEIKESGAVTIQEVLRKVAGIQVNTTGSRGSTSSVMMRGAGSAQTLVLIDGAPANDPLSGGFDLSGISLENIERIEIVSGQGSAVHGSEAGGGVINIITSGGKKGFVASAEYSRGSFHSEKELLSVKGGMDKLSGSLSIDRYGTRNDGEREGFNNTSYSGRIDGSFGSNGFSLSSRNFDSSKNIGMETDYDFMLGGLVQHIDGNSWQDYRGNCHSASHTFSSAENFWRHTARASLSKGRIAYSDNADDDEPFGGDINSLSESEVRNFSVIEEFDWNRFRTAAGFEYEKGEGSYYSTYESMFFDSISEYNENYINKGYFAEFKYRSDMFNADLSARYDDHSEFGNDLNGRASVMYKIQNGKYRIVASYGTSFRAPSLNELFFPGWGNPELEPEEGRGWEFSFRCSLLDSKLDGRMSIFRNKYDNLISSDPVTYTAANIEESKVNGAEAAAGIELPLGFFIDASYTYMETEDTETGEQLLRRPKNKGALTLSKIGKNYTAGIEGIFLSSMRDIKIVNIPERIPAHNIANAFLKITCPKGMYFKARVENLFDKDYMELAGFPAPGRNFLFTLGFTVDRN